MEIIGFEQAWREQEDLDALGAEMDEFETVECCVDNAEYGFADILKAYSGYPADMPVQAVIPLGVYLDPAGMLANEEDAPVPAVLNYPAFRSGTWENRGDKVVVPSASPFLYALELFRERFEPVAEPRGSIFFLKHTIRGMRATVSWEKTIEELLELDDGYQPVTVCVDIRDHNAGIHVPFEQAGMRVVSAGTSKDPQFIFRWMHLLSAHSRAVINDVGSLAIYASRFGLPVLLLHNVVTQVFADPTQLMLQNMHGERESAKQADKLRQRILELFREDAGRREQPLLETVDYLLGAENFKTPDGLRADLERVAELVG